jgi:hypothetical protein
VNGRVGLVIVSIALLTTACSTAGEGATTSPPETKGSISPQQREALKDGVVSWDEYEAGFTAYRTCLGKHGYKMLDPHVEGDLFEFSVPLDADDSNVDQKCYSYTWSRVDDEWQLAHEDTSPSAQVVKNCLLQLGRTPSSSFQSNVRLLQESGMRVEDCPT